MNYQDGYSQKALDALAKGKYKSLRSSGLANYRYTEGKKKRDNAVVKQNKTQNPTPRNTNAMANDPSFSLPSVSLPVPTLPMVSAMQNDPRYQAYDGDQVLNQLLNNASSTVQESPSLSDMIPKQSGAKRSKAKPSTRYTNETVKNVETPAKPKFDSDMEKEFEEFFNYRYDQADVVDYDPVTQTDTEHWRNLKKDIMQKHGWSEKDFKKNYGEYEKYRHDTMKADYAKNTNDFAEKVPVLPSLYSLGLNIGSSLEGASTAIRGIIGNKNLEKIRDLLPDAAGYYEGGANDNIDTKAKEALRQGEREKIDSKVGQTAYDMAMGLGDMGVNTALGGGTPLGMGIASGLQNAAQNETHALERGIDEDWAARYGLATGAVAGLMNTVGLDSVLKSTGSSVIKNILSSAGKEGLENVAEDIADRFIDGIMNGENSEQKQLVNYYLESGLSQEEAYQKAANDFFIQELTSFGSGALFGGLMSGAKNLPQLGAFVDGKLADRDARKNPTVAGILDGTITESPRVPDVVEQARAQAERAQAEVERLNEQLPEMPEAERSFTDMSPEEQAALQAELDNEYNFDVNEVAANDTGIDTNPTITEEVGNTAPANTQPVILSDDAKSDIKATARQIKQSFNGKVNYIKDGNNKYAIQFKKSIDEFANNPSSETYAKMMNDYENYAANSGSHNKMTWDGRWYEKTFDANPIRDRLNEVANKYGFGTEHTANGSTPQSEPAKMQAAGESAPIETPESVVAELNQTPVEATNDTGIDNRVPTVTEGNVPTANNGGNDDTGVSRLITRSARSADIVSEYEYENDPVVQNIAKYAKHNNENTFNNALDNVKQNGGQLLEEYNNGARKIDNDQDVDQSMLILQGLTERMRAGEDVSAQRNLLLSKLRKAATTWGQNIQAFAKWNDTADGALINGDRILSGRSEEWETRNQKKVNRNKKVAEDLSKIPTAEYDGTKIDNGTGYKVPKVNQNQTNTKLNNALKKQGYDGTMDIPKEPKTREQIRKEVVNSLKKEYGSVENQFSDQDVDYITNLINEGATTDELAKALNTKMATGAFGISADTQNKVNLLFDEASKYDPNSVDANRAKAAAYKLIADEVVGKATPYEKFEAWRYIAMLGNPKTMFRNFVGNTTFNVVTGVSNGLSGALEAAVDYPIRAGKWASNKLFKTDFDTSKGIERTKSLAAVIPTKKNASLVKAAWDDAYEHRYNEMSGQKYEKGVQDKIRDSKSVFNSKWAQLYEKLTDAGISDTFAVRTKYSTSLAGYLRANGIDDGIFEADKRFRKLEDASRQRALTESERADLDSLRSDHEKLEKARDYAVKEAEYATFHEDNKVAQLLSEFSTKARNSDNVVAKGIGYIFEGVMPFKKTPSNIVRSGYDFSPFGAISSIKKTGKLIYENTGGRRGNLADTYKTKSGKEVSKTLASDVIESWARNLTGTGMMMLGYYLTSKGILNSSKKDELYQDELEGKQNYSITINGHTYTIDWAAPASMSLLMGAELHKIVERNAIPGKKVYENVGDVIGTINSLIDPIVETSMMQGVKNTLETAASVARYDDNAGAGLGVLGTMAANAGLNYVSQVVPTILGQAARVIDPVRRSTDTVSPNSFVAGMEKQGRKMMNKIPFLSMLNNPYVNARGEEELNSPSANPLVSIPYQFISPGYLQEINQTEADKSARAVYNAGVPMLDEEGKPLLDENGEQVLVPQMDKGVFETWKSKVTVGEHKFTPDEMYQYRTTAGQANEAIRTALAQEEWFSNLNPQAQNDLLKSVNTLVDKLGKETVGYPQDDKALDVYKEGGIPDLLNYYKEKAVEKQVQAETGLSAQAKKTAEITDAILAGRTDEANQMIAEETQKQEALKPYEDSAEALGIKAQDYSYIKDYAGNSWSKVEPELPKLKGMGVTNYSQYAHAVKYADSNNQSVDAQWFANTTKALDTDKSGGVSQDELIDEFNNKNMSESEVMRLWGMLALGKDGAETKQVPYIITKGKNKGKWGRH